MDTRNGALSMDRVWGNLGTMGLRPLLSLTGGPSRRTLTDRRREESITSLSDEMWSNAATDLLLSPIMWMDDDDG